MNVNKTAKKANALRAAIQKEVTKRDAAMQNHGCEANQLFARFEALIKKLRTALEIRCANRAIKLATKHLEAKAALESIK